MIVITDKVTLKLRDLSILSEPFSSLTSYKKCASKTSSIMFVPWILFSQYSMKRSSSSSLWRSADTTYSLDSLSQYAPNSYHSWYVLKVASSVCKEIMNKNFAGQPTRESPWVVFQRKISIMYSSLFHKLYPSISCLSRIVYRMGGKWPYSYCFVGCCSKHQAAFLLSSHMGFSLSVSLESSCCSHTIVLTPLELGRIII